MKLIVMDLFAVSKQLNKIPEGHGFTITNPTFIPRVGDRVELGYEPPPYVKTVIWNFQKEIVFVYVE